MNIVTLDFETYWDADYILSKMTTEAYVRDPRFEVHGVGILWHGRDNPWTELAGCRQTCCLTHIGLGKDHASSATTHTLMV